MMRFVSVLFFIAFVSCYQGQNLEVELDLSGRSLNAIPDSVFAMVDLECLNLGSCNGVKMFPPLSALVDTCANSIVLLPHEIGRLKNLKTLILNSNKLDSLPSSITQLTKLELLDLSLNKDLDIIRELDKLKKLPSLKILGAIGMGSMNESAMELVKKELPDTRVIFSFEEYFDSK